MESMLPMSTMESIQFLFENDNQIKSNETSNIGNDNQVEYKLKVDRKKFESLLNESSDEKESADTFFAKIMLNYPSVSITWPSKLKSGAKSKKDPHVKITGKSEMVRQARNSILEVLDPKRDRVTLKMDIDWTTHSHIIGKAGSSIQNVMDSTGCHIHFPDANCTNTLEKSNQVSIAGTANGANEARISVRQLLPIILYFKLIFKHLTGGSYFFETQNQIIQIIQQITSTQITLRFGAPNLMIPVVMVYIRGTYGKSKNLKLAVELMTKYVGDYIMNDVCYNIDTEISSQHRYFVLGTNGQNVKSIMQITGAFITYPDTFYEYKSNEPMPKSSNKSAVKSYVQQKKTRSTVNIKAFKIDSVLNALHYLLMHLPLSLTFDLREGEDIDPNYIEELSKNLNINITTKAKLKQNTKSIWIKAPEMDSLKLFEARKRILKNNGPINNNASSIWSFNDHESGLWSPNYYNEETNDNKSANFNRAPGAERCS